jgi:hypothetical protein
MATLHECTLHHNGEDGVVAADRGVVNLCGVETDISSNGAGIHAVHMGKVNIHLPAVHNTTHDNHTDRFAEQGGSIANINYYGQFNHVPAAWVLDAALQGT